MKIKIVLILFSCITWLSTNGQVIYVTTYKSDADKIVYVTKNKSEATMIAYEEAKYKAEAKPYSGIWYYTKYVFEADWKVYFTDNKYEADLVVYFTKNKYEAGMKGK